MFAMSYMAMKYDQYSDPMTYFLLALAIVLLILLVVAIIKSR